MEHKYNITISATSDWSVEQLAQVLENTAKEIRNKKENHWSIQTGGGLYVRWDLTVSK